MNENVVLARLIIAVALAFNSEINYLVVALAEIPMVTQREVCIFRVCCLPQVSLLLIGAQEAVLLLAARFVGLGRLGLRQIALDLLI